MLDFTKEELKEYLLQNNINFAYDKSNEEEKYLRNKIRKFLNTLEDKELINDRITLASNSILKSKKIIENYEK